MSQSVMSESAAPRLAAVVVALAVGTALGSCSAGSDAGTSAATSTRPEVCDSAEDLHTSLAALQDVEVAQRGSAAALEQAWARVQQTWATFVDDARAEHGDEVDSVQAGARAVDDAVDAASDTPSADTLGSAATAVRAFLQDAGALAEEASSTC